MEQVNDIVFRLLCKKAGAGITFTPMIHPLTKQKIILDDKPILQLFTSNLNGIKEFIKKYDKKVSGWDFNLGCPAKTAERQGFGVFLHPKLKTIEKILKEIRASTKKPFSIKLRKSRYALKIVLIANKYCDVIIIHPRTQKQGYSGEPDISFARKLRESTNLPVVYSGDVNEMNYKELLKEFDYIMIGRKAIGNPNLFSILTNKKIKKITFEDYLKLAKKYNIPFKQIKFQALNFTKGMKNSANLRNKISKLKTLKEILSFYQKNSLI